MPLTTPVYGWPYQTLTDAPDGPNLGEDLALAIEATLQSNLASINSSLSAAVASLAFVRAKPVAKLRQSVIQGPLTAGVFTPLTFTTEDYDSHNGHDNVTNPSRYTIQQAGVYFMFGGFAINSSAGTIRGSQYKKNGTSIPGTTMQVPPGGFNAVVPARAAIVSLIVGDFIELAVDPGTSASTFVTSDYQSTFEIAWLRDP
jgi:hypothetical protein